MDNLVSKISPVSRYIAMGALFAGTLFLFIASAATIGGGFFPVIGGLFLLLFNVAVYGSVPTFLALKKDDLATGVLIPVLSFWIISTIYDSLSAMSVIASGYSGVSIARGVFYMFVAFTMIAAVVMGILYLAKKKKSYLQISTCLFIGSTFFFFIVWILSLCVYAKFDLDWYNYISAFASFLFFPIGFAFAFLDRVYVNVYGEDLAPASTDEMDEFISKENPSDDE